MPWSGLRPGERIFRNRLRNPLLGFARGGRGGGPGGLPLGRRQGARRGITVGTVVWARCGKGDIRVSSCGMMDDDTALRTMDDGDLH